MDSLPERFWAKVEKTDGCWEWRGWRTPKGYGGFRLSGRDQYAHRVSYEASIGPIPDGLVIDHLCRNSGCVNPAHLEAVTQKENLRRGLFAPGKRGGDKHNRLKTHCPKGHEYAGHNLIEYRGRRYCRSCMAVASARARQKRHGRRPYLFA